MWGFEISISLFFLSTTYIGYFLAGIRWGKFFYVTVAYVIGSVFGASSTLLGIDAILNCSPMLALCLLSACAVMMVLSCLASIAIYKRRYS